MRRSPDAERPPSPGKATTPVIQESGHSAGRASAHLGVPALRPSRILRRALGEEGQLRSGTRSELSSRLARASIVGTAARTNGERRSSPVRNPSSREDLWPRQLAWRIAPMPRTSVRASSRSIPSSRARLRIAAERASNLSANERLLPSARAAGLWLPAESRASGSGVKINGVATHADDAIGRPSVDVRSQIRKHLSQGLYTYASNIDAGAEILNSDALAGRGVQVLAVGSAGVRGWPTHAHMLCRPRRHAPTSVREDANLDATLIGPDGLAAGCWIASAPQTEATQG